MRFTQRLTVPGAALPSAWLWILALGLFVQLTGLLFNNDGSRYATQIFLLLFVPALLLLLWRRLSLDTWRQASGCLLLGLLAWVVLCSLFNSGSAKDPAYWLRIVGLILLYVFTVASLVRQQKAFNGLLVVVVALVVLFAWLTLYYQFGVLDRLLEYNKLRVDGRLSEMGWRGMADLKHPVIAGLYYGVFAVLLLYLFVGLKLRVWQAGLLALGMLGLLAYVLLTFSRGAWFSTAAGSFVLLLLFPNTRSRSLTGAGCLLVLVTAYLFWPEIQGELKRGVSGRQLIWDSWGDRLPEFWLMGQGAGGNFDFRFYGGSTVIHAHSLYLQLWYEYGIVGIVLFVLLLLSLLWKGWQCRAQPLARLGIALLVYAMVAMVSDVYAIFHRPSPYWVLFWFPVGILLGVRPGDADERAAASA